MQNSIQINYDEFEQQLESQAQSLKECNSLVITNVPSAKKAFELISKDWFKSRIQSHQNVFGICLKINENINDKFDAIFHFIEFSLKDSSFISFQSTIDKCENKIYWKVPGHENLFSLHIDEDTTTEISSFFQEFLVDELKNGRTGIINKACRKNKIRLQEIGDITGNNLLVIATSKNNFTVVNKLIEHDFDADCAIDTAWKLFVDDNNEKIKEEASKIIICLLNANSRLPDDFEYEKASKDIKKFIEKCESLHKDVDEDNFDALKLKLESEPNLIHFYNRYNESLLAYSLKNRKFKIFELLDKEITTGCDEDLEEAYENMIKRDFKLLRNQHKLNAKEFPETHIFILKSKSKICNNDKLSHKKWKFIEEAFETLNRNDYCKKILKVAAEYKKLKIYFDFKHDSTYYLDPATSIYSQGIIYESGPVFIGAKYLTDDEGKFAVLGVLAHEMCHLAVYLAFMNRNFDPFPLGESDWKTRFINQVMVQCKERKESEKIVANVFRSYEEDIQNSEMIVTVPQILMHYIKNPAKIEELERIFEELFKYSQEIVEPKLEEALPVLKILGDKERLITFEKLTEPMKAKILHSKINFHGTETTFFELVGNDQKTIKLLKPEDIRGILMKNFKLEVGPSCKSNPKYKIIARSFIKTKVYEDICRKDSERSNREKIDIEYQIQAKKKVFDEIMAEAEKKKVFLLIDDAGAGKTTYLEDIALKLKKCCTSNWVSLINLRENMQVFEEFKNIRILNLTKILQFLLNCVNQKKDIELRIFVDLFLRGKLILLFDGVDEISPKFTEFIERVFQFLKSSTKNQLWVSSRPHYAKKLEQILNCSAYKFTSYTKDEKTSFIQNILKTKNIHDEKELSKITQYIQTFMSHLDVGLISTKQIDNSLMIKHVTELFADKAIDRNIKGNYAIHSAMFDKRIQERGKKFEIPLEELLGKFPIMSIHEVLALKVIIEDDYQKMLTFNFNDLVLLKKFERVKDKLTCDMIQRLGFVNVDLSKINQKGSINFVHITYAEFFVAQFLINTLLGDNLDDSDEEITQNFEIFDIACKHSLGHFLKVSFFIFSNLKNESKNSVFHEKIRPLFIKKISEIHREISSNNMNIVDYFGAYANVLSIDPILLKKLWLTGQENNVLKHLIFKYDNKNYGKITSFAESSYGSEWHEVLSGKKLITNEKIENLFEDNIKDSAWVFSKNLVKLCDLVDQCYNREEKLKFYINVDLDRIGNTKIRYEILTRMRENAHADKFIPECLEELCVRTISTESLAFVLNQFEKALNIDRNIIRNHLRKYVPKILHNTYDSDLSGTFEILKNFFLNYFTREELEDIIVNDLGSFNILEGAENMYYSEYKQFIHDIYSPSNFSKIIDRMWFFSSVIFNDTDVTQKRVTQERVRKNTKDLLLMIFSNNENITDYFMSHIQIVDSQNKNLNPY